MSFQLLDRRVIKAYKIVLPDGEETVRFVIEQNIPILGDYFPVSPVTMAPGIIGIIGIGSVVHFETLCIFEYTNAGQYFYRRLYYGSVIFCHAAATIFVLSVQTSIPFNLDPECFSWLALSPGGRTTSSIMRSLCWPLVGSMIALFVMLVLIVTRQSGTAKQIRAAKVIIAFCTMVVIKSLVVTAESYKFARYCFIIYPQIGMRPYSFGAFIEISYAAFAAIAFALLAVGLALRIAFLSNKIVALKRTDEILTNF